MIVLLAVLLQGPLDGALSSLLVGACVGLLSFGAGALLGRDAVAKLLTGAGPKLQALNALVARRGFLAVFIARLVPAAPFAVVNLMLGVTPIRWPAFLAGTLVGMLPMVALTAWLAPEILQQLREPTQAGWLLVLTVVALIAAISWGLQRWARRA
jgi:phospholipase D1/2